ncbi:MAG: hypothetical protein K5657_05785 [Desulfovibrio sp.]|nr:hypothetical protein [Desulfovibrio sp.]
MSEFSYCSLWNANADNPVVHALRDRSTISLRGYFSHMGECKDLALEGTLKSLDGRDGLLAVKQCVSISERTQREQDTECPFSFTMMRKQKDGTKAQFSVSGQALIIQTKNNHEKALESIHIRFPRNCNVRRLRMNPRYEWKPEFVRLLRIMVPTSIPENRDDLAKLLRQYTMAPIEGQEICDISAGGVCAILGTDAGRGTFAADRLYLFFFISSKSKAGENPFVLLAQRLGYGQAKNQGQQPPVRMRFLAEMDWTTQEQKIRWLDVRSEGSHLLREHLKRFKDCTATDGKTAEKA